MKYLSIGAVVAECTEYILEVCRCGNRFQLTGELAVLWLNGRMGFAIAEKPKERKALDQLVKMGLAILANGPDAEEYRLENNPESPPSSRDEGLRLLHGLETNLGTSLQTPQEA